MQETNTSLKTQRTPTSTFHATRRLILGDLALYPLLRAIDLAVALNRTVQAHQETPFDASNISRHLRHLARGGMVEPMTDTRCAAPLWRLTRGGMAVITQMSDEASATLLSLCKASHPLMRRGVNGLGRMVGVQRTVLGLCLHAPDGFAALDRGKRPGVAWHWMREWQHRFLWQRRMITARADAVIVWQRTPRHYAGPVAFADVYATPASLVSPDWRCAFVLLAEEHETGVSIRRRVQRLVQYREAAERLPVYGEFPPILILVQHPRARERWREALTDVAQHERVPPLAGAMAMLPEGQSGIGDPWRLRWESLSDGTGMMLAEVLVPLAREAWPAGLADHLLAATTLMQRLRTASGTFAREQESLSAPTTRRMMIHAATTSSAELGPRHERVLTLLAQHPLLSLSEVSALLGLKESSTERYLRDLQRVGDVQRCERFRSPSAHAAMDSESRWWLTQDGANAAAITAGKATIQRAAQGRQQSTDGTAGVSALKQANLTQSSPSDRLPRHAEHLWGIYGFLAALHRTAPSHQASVCWWEMGEACERSYPWHRAQRNLRPDAEFELAQLVDGSTRPRRFWLEYDRGTMRRHDLEAKMGAYADYLRSHEWMKDGIGRAALPRLLFVVPDSEQERRVAEACAACLGGYRLRVQVTTTGRVEAASPYGAIWRQVYPPPLHQDPAARMLLWA